MVLLILVDGVRDAAIGGAGGEMLGRHQGRNAPNAGAAGVGAGGVGAGSGAPSNPSKMHGKLEEIEGKVERGIGKVAGSASME